jgi:DNA polymerase-3 subunit epsilon
MLDWLADYRRSRLLRQTNAGALLDYYRQPFVSRNQDCRKLELVALDLETTGLNSQQDQILSIGVVTLRQQQIELASAQHYLICPDRNIPEQSAMIHHITDDLAADGESLQTVLSKLLPQLTGKAMIAHHASIELQFLDRACHLLYGAGFMIPVIDTQNIARRTLERHNQIFKPEQLRLAECRQRYHLPRYRLHNALSDALATAELFLVQMAQYDQRKSIPLKDFLS